MRWAGVAMVLGMLGCDGAELPGLPDALPVEHPFCGGMAGLPCASDLVCIDEPGDGCGPGDGADCGGICVACDDARVDRSVVSDDPRECAAMEFDCPGRQVAWFDDCGCGCQAP